MLSTDQKNAMRSAIEVHRFRTDPPDRYFLYIDPENQLATTWTGQKLGRVIFGHGWRSNFGDRRQAIDVIGINGRRYHGTFYKSAGNYARIRAYK